MALTEDYTIKNGLGIRITARKTCQVIRKQKGAWQEIGKVYDIPVAEEDLRWGDSQIPASVLAVALRAYELDHPQSRLRSILTRRVARPRLLQAMAVNG
jgi:hypothetical protein